MNLYIVRHGQTEANVERLIQGHKDFPLTDLGISQSISTGKLLKGTSFDKVQFIQYFFT